MGKVKGVRAIRYEHGHSDTCDRAVLARVCLGWENIRINGRRGLVGEPPEARDGRGIADVPDFLRLGHAWKLLNYFAGHPETEVSDGLPDTPRGLFYSVLEEGALGHRRAPAEVARAIADAAITAVRYFVTHRGYL